MKSLSKFIVFEITQCLPIKDILKLSGVSKRLQKMINYKNCNGKYIFLQGNVQQRYEVVTINIAGRGKVSSGNKQTYLDTKLLHTCEQGNSNAVSVLIKAGAKIDIQNTNHRYIPLFVACSENKETIVKILLDYKINKFKSVDIDGIDVFGNTALIEAVDVWNTDIVKLLLERGADPNKCNDRNNTPLMMASDRGFYDIVDILLKYGAESNCMNEECQTAIDFAHTSHHREIVKLLLQYGAKTQCNKEGCEEIQTKYECSTICHLCNGVFCSSHLKKETDDYGIKPIYSCSACIEKRNRVFNYSDQFLQF